MSGARAMMMPDDIVGMGARADDSAREWIARHGSSREREGHGGVLEHARVGSGVEAVGCKAQTARVACVASRCSGRAPMMNGIAGLVGPVPNAPNGRDEGGAHKREMIRDRRRAPRGIWGEGSTRIEQTAVKQL